MHLPLFIAKRYLFAKKKRNAINIISLISIIGVAVGTSALIVVLSVFNGIDKFLQDTSESLKPDIVILPNFGKFIKIDSSFNTILNDNPYIALSSPYIEEKTMLKYVNTLKPVVVRGVKENYGVISGFDNRIVKGSFDVGTVTKAFGVAGYNLAAELGLDLQSVATMQFFYPNRKAKTMAQSLHSEVLFPSGFFVSQQETDAKMIFTHISFARKLFMRDSNEYSGIEIRLEDGQRTEEVKDALKSQLGDGYQVLDRYEQNRSFYAMMKSEKMAIFLILLFILLIASFNIVGSITMLILDKKEDLKIYRALGMTHKKLIAIFGTEGGLITFIGCALGVFIGVLLCWLQERYGFITLGNGSYAIEAYPVQLIVEDIIRIIAAVLAIGCIASYFPVRYIITKRAKIIKY